MISSYQWYFSFEKCVPAHWYRKISEVQQNCKQKIFAKVPRIEIAPPYSNTDQKALENERSSNEEYEDFEERRFHGKRKGLGKNSYRKTKSLIEDDN